MTNFESRTCSICGRTLDSPSDPLSIDCGGDCWGCVGEAEAELGDPDSLAKVREEFALGLRPGWIDPRPTMAPALQSILEAELMAGNTVVEVSCWPPKCTLLVILGHEFKTTVHVSDNVTFHEINDPHYWKAEYRYGGGTEVLACKFN